MQQAAADTSALGAAASVVETADPQPLDFAEILSNLVDKLSGWVEDFILLLPNLVIAVLIVLVAVLAARGVRSVVMRLMRRISGPAGGAAGSVGTLLSTLAYVAVLAVGVFVALSVLELDKAVTTLLAGAGVIGLALGFAFQDIAANFISGVMIALRTPFDIGDVVETNGHMGVVRDINLRATHVKTFQGQDVIIPNSQVIQNPMVNYTRLGQRRVDLGCGVGYGDDLQHAEDVAKRALSEVAARDTSRDVEVFWTEFGDSSINFTACYWVDFRKQTDFLAAQSEGIKRLKTAFDENGVTIPFPIRTLDFGPNGGVELREMLAGHAGNGTADTTPQGEA